MKKYIIIPLICGFVSLNLNISNKTKNQISINMDNIEALANNEGNNDPQCHYTGSLDCPAWNTKAKYIW